MKCAIVHEHYVIEDGAEIIPNIRGASSCLGYTGHQHRSHTKLHKLGSVLLRSNAGRTH